MLSDTEHRPDGPASDPVIDARYHVRAGSPSLMQKKVTLAAKVVTKVPFKKNSGPRLWSARAIVSRNVVHSEGAP